MSISSVTGKVGEDTAASYLCNHGFSILERNYRSHAGEIDIVALTGDTLVFVEVKCWRGYESASLEDAINHRKVGRIIRTAEEYLSHDANDNGRHVRFDVIFIDPDSQRVDHIEHAFTENGC